MSVVYVLARKTYDSRLQYSASHGIRTAASVIFGLIYISIWTGIGSQHSLGTYGVAGMVSYVAFNQVILWTVFPSWGLGLAGRVQTGQIATDLMRPVHLFTFAVSREAGSIAYNTLFTAVPLYMLYVLFTDLDVPGDPLVWTYTAAAVLMASYVSLCMQYVIGVTALWTVESNWLAMCNYSVSFILSGFLIPLEWMLDWLREIARWSPYPVLHALPAKLYMGLAGPETLLQPLVWFAILTVLSLGVTRLVRYKVEVQGG